MPRAAESRSVLVGVMRSFGRFLAVFILFGIGWASAAGAVQRPGNTADPNIGLSFHTLDGDVQQVNVDEIWRVRGASGHDEPAGSVVIDYAFERLFVKESLDNVIDAIRHQRKIEKFTSPSGAPIYIMADKVIGIARALPIEHHQNSKSILIAREGQQQVQESREAVREALGK